jgi:hypothetical protein
MNKALYPQEVRCLCGKKFGQLSSRQFVLELKGKFRLEADLTQLPPGWLRAICDDCGKTKQIA